MRLKELSLTLFYYDNRSFSCLREGLIECTEEKRSPKMVLWRLTEKGKDTLPILMQMVAFGSKWHADIVFEDKMPRKLNDIFPQPEAREIIKGHA
jgi:DNA-binding PadR family transcriptional regulator